MKSIIACIVLFASACGAGYSNQRSRSAYVYDDGVTPAKSVTVTHEGRANAASIGLPIGPAPYGFGGGLYGHHAPVMAGGDMCVVHPDYCGVVATTAVTTDRDLERRVDRVEGQTKALGSAYRVMIEEGRKTNARVSELEKRQEVLIKVSGRSYKLDRAQCLHLQKNPGIIEDAEIKSKADEACNEILGVIETTEEEGDVQ